MRFVFGFLAAIFLVLPVAGQEIGDDGLHKQDWMRDTFKDLNEDLAEATAEGKRLVLFFEQRGCVYCVKMHAEVFSDPEVSDYIEENFFVVQLNLHGSEDVTDFDGDVRIESKIARKWGILFTPTIMFLPEETTGERSAMAESVAMLPGAFGKGTTLDLFTWVNEGRYADQSEEDFQRYHARRISERNNGDTD
ncbi:MAG: thioredoxin family protein [Paracoccaceae bacterium]